MHLTPWLEAAAVTWLALAGVLLGYWFSHLPKPYWTFGYFIPLTLAVIKYSFLLDHYLTVLQLTNDEVVVGDPMKGKITMARDEFEKRWRFVGVVLRRGSSL